MHRVRGKLVLPRRRQSFFAVCNKLRAALVCSSGTTTTTTHSLSARVMGASAVFSFHSCRCRGHHGCRVITSLHTRVVHFTHLAKKKKKCSLLVASPPFGLFFFICALRQVFRAAFSELILGMAAQSHWLWSRQMKRLG